MSTAYSIRIKFDQELQENPERVFEAMALFIKGFNELQAAFIFGYGSEMEFTSSLQRTREGSCVADIAHNINEKVRLLNITDLWTSIYFKLENAISKPRVFDTEDDITNFISEVTETEQVDNIAHKLFTSHPNPDPFRVANGLKTISEGIKKLSDKDKSEIAINDNFNEINKEIKFPRSPNEIFSKKIKAYPARETLIIKKPDYVGNSKWEFISLKRKSKSIFAKISHTEWLEKWHNHEIQIWPGDGLEVEIVTRAKKSKIDQVPHFEDEIVKVIRVVPQSDIKQLGLDF